MEDREEGEEETETDDWTPPVNRLFERVRQDGILRSFTIFIDESWKTEPPPAIETFLKENSTILVITGIFAAVIVYLLELSNGQTETLVKGMVAGAVLFGIALGILLKNTYIAFSKAYVSRSFFYSFMYIVIAFSITYMGLAMLMFFRQYPTIAVSTIDILLVSGFLMALLSVALLQPNIHNPPNSLGFVASKVYSASGLIAYLILTPALYYFEFYDYLLESNFLILTSISVMWILLWVAIAGFVVLADLAWRGVLKRL